MADENLEDKTTSNIEVLAGLAKLAVGVVIIAAIVGGCDTLAKKLDNTLYTWKKEKEADTKAALTYQAESILYAKGAIKEAPKKPEFHNPSLQDEIKVTAAGIMSNGDMVVVYEQCGYQKTCKIIGKIGPEEKQ